MSSKKVEQNFEQNSPIRLVNKNKKGRVFQKMVQNYEKKE